MTSIRLIAGLGNPGKQYVKTRHNAGYWWVDAIASEYGATWSKEPKMSGEVARVRKGALDVWLLKPTTYMNESGRAVAAMMNFYRVELGELLVVHDELDLPPGTVKLKSGGGTGGHNGLNDIAEKMGDKAFWRLRIGIGHPGHKDLVADYVLNNARREEQDLIDPAWERSLALLPMLAEGRLTDAMKWLHTAEKPAAETKPEGKGKE